MEKFIKKWIGWVSYTLRDELIKEMQSDLERVRIEGVLLGLKICKEMWAQGTISHENIYENEVYYREQLEALGEKF